MPGAAQWRAGTGTRLLSHLGDLLLSLPAFLQKALQAASEVLRSEYPGSPAHCLPLHGETLFLNHL